MNGSLVKEWGNRDDPFLFLTGDQLLKPYWRGEGSSAAFVTDKNIGHCFFLCPVACTWVTYASGGRCMWAYSCKFIHERWLRSQV